MQPIPLIRAATVAGVANVLGAQGYPGDRMLEQARIPLSVREDLLGFVPGRCVWTFVGEISRRGGPPDFLIDIARLSDWRCARWVPPLAHAATLGEALVQMCSSWVREIPMVSMGLTRNGPVAWFWRLRRADVRGWDGNEAAEQYTLSFMLEVIRAATGPDWQPPVVMLESSPSGWATGSRALAGARKAYDRPVLAVAIPLRLLALPISIKPPPCSSPPGETGGEDFRSSLRQILQASMVDGPPVQSVVAETLGMGERSLRRRLEMEDTTWRSVVNEIKFARAVERLVEGQASVREVARKLGYSDAAHFTRFFEGRTGVAPSRWRKLVEQTQRIRRSTTLPA